AAGYPAGAEVPASATRQAIAVNNALGRTNEALAIAEDATRRFADDPAVWSQYATVLTSAGRHADAIQALSRVIELDPNYENIYIRRAQAQIEAGNRSAALADLELAAQRGNPETVGEV